MAAEKKKEFSTALLVVLGIIAALLFTILVTVGYVIGSYNMFVVADQDINNQWSNVKTEYQRRADLLINQVEVAKGYADFEQETMTAVIKARAGNFGKTTDEQMKNMNALDQTFSKLMLTWEQYPNLKTIEQYNKLTEELQRTENRVQIARSDYNSLVRSYNILVTKFPRSIVARMNGYYVKPFFENENGGTNAPELDMNR